MRISPEKLADEAQATGFRPDVLEKVAHLLGLLDAMRSHPFLKGKLVLKGGTALNLCVFDVPRLSVDIDLNYVGAEDRESMVKGMRPSLDDDFCKSVGERLPPCCPSQNQSASSWTCCLREGKSTRRS